MPNSIHIGNLDWPGARLQKCKSIFVAEPSRMSPISRILLGVTLNEPVIFPEGVIGEYGESFENDIWEIHSVPPKRRLLTAEESVIPEKVLVMLKWLQHHFDCAGGVWYRINADLSTFVEVRLNRPHKLQVTDLCFPTKFILNLCQEVRDHCPR